ncbi:MAG: LEA type 2 family protein [Candidatus Manganitrophaceae bacterium]
MRKGCRFVFFYLLFIVMIGYAGCAPTKIVSAPEWRIQAVEMDRLDFSGAHLSVAVRITNPNPFGLTVSHLLYRLSIGEGEIASGEISVPFIIARHGSADVVLPIEVRFKQIGKLAPLLREKSGGIDYRIEGEVTVRALGMQKTVPIGRSGKTGRSSD